MTVPWQCRACRAQVAPGAPRCPECPSTEFTTTEAEAGEVLKINRDGIVSDSADVRAAEAAQDRQLAGIEAALEPGGSFHVEGGFSGPEGLEVLKAPAEGASEPEVPPAPVPPRPPRRSPPPAVPRE